MGENGAQAGTIETRIPSRLDRLPWLRFHWMVAIGLDREIQIIGRALEDRGSANRRELASRVGARYWGPGRFRAALREAVAEGAVKRLRGEYAPARSPSGHEDGSSRRPAEH